jgi:adenylate kinase
VFIPSFWRKPESRSNGEPGANPGGFTGVKILQNYFGDATMKSSMDFDAIIFIGPQGSGKGTQAKFFADRLGFFYWGMGAMLREIATRHDDLGEKIGEVINRGKLLDDETIFKIVEAKVAAVPQGKGIIFDGVPRRLAQAEYLMSFLRSARRDRAATVYLSLPHDVSVDRLTKRAEIEGRTDDTRERIEFRLNQYERETVPVLAYLKKTTQFFEIDGTPPPDSVTREIAKALNVSLA